MDDTLARVRARVAERFPADLERIRGIVPGYDDAPTDEAFFRMFERDKAELRELAQGIHPVVLTDLGLRPALEALAARSPVPVERARPLRRSPAATSRRSSSSSQQAPAS